MRKLAIILFMVIFSIFLNSCVYILCVYILDLASLAMPTQDAPQQTKEEMIQEQIREEEVARMRSEQAALARKNAIYPMEFEMICTGFEKKGPYTITLVFQPGDTPIQEFEKELRNNVTGEIEIRRSGKHYQTINYEDYIGFVPAPVGTGYGPTYTVYMEYGDFDIYPRIRAKKAYSYSLAIKRHQQSVGEKLRDLFRSEPQEKQTTSSNRSRPELHVPAKLERFDRFDFLGDINLPYSVSLGIRRIGKELDDDEYFFRTVCNDSVGTIEILRDDNPLRKLDFISSVYKEAVGAGTLFYGWYYGVFSDEDQIWYSIIPKMFSSQQNRSFAIRTQSVLSFK